MTFEEILDQAVAMIQRRRRVTYRTLKLQFKLDDETLEALKAELLYSQPQVIDDDGRGFMWTGDTEAASVTASHPTPPEPQPVVEQSQPVQATSTPVEPHTPEAERRQLTVMFCDLVDSTLLSSQLDPEELRDVLRAYQEASARVIARFEGYIAQYLGDGLLVYFGYPMAHEDDAQRAVRTGLGIVEALGQLNTQLAESGVQMAVRLGIHTGIVVVGDVGGGARQEQLALGETPNVAARLQGLAAPNTVVISAATRRLLGGFFDCKSLGTPPLRGLTQSLEVFEVQYERMARSRLGVAGRVNLTPLVGREQEIELLRERWRQVKDGVGQVVLLSGEAGIGKSRLVELLKEQVAAEPQAWLTPCQCSPYHQHSAWYPMIDLFERVVLGFEPEESPQQKLRKLEGLLVQYGLPLAETVPLLAALFSLPLTPEYAPLPGSPEQQRQQTLHAFLTMLLRIAAHQPVLFVMEDLHWVDATTLEFLNLVVDQGPTARILALLTFRPDFAPPWTGRSHLSHMTLHRLTRSETAEIAIRVAQGKALPPEIIDQVVVKTDGVPLFVEELTKMVLESGLLLEQEDHYALTAPLPALAIPATLHDSLMARLDRLATVKALAQLGATLGREFSYALLHAVSPWGEATLQQGLRQLVEAEFLYQRGLPPQATYVFKHALIQETAYQSLLRITRQQYHQRIAQILEVQFPETAATQPERLAHHYTEAGLLAEAIPYWQRAGQRALESSANVEAVAHLTRGLDVLKALSDAPERARRELVMQITLGRALSAVKGQAAPEVLQTYARARELCEQVGEAPQLFQVLRGLQYFYQLRMQLQTARQLGEELLALAEDIDDLSLRLEAHYALGNTLNYLAEFTAAQAHFEQVIDHYDVQRYRDHGFRFDQDVGVSCLVYAAVTLWCLGYPDQAVQRSREALTLAQELAHPMSLAYALFFGTWVYQFRREWRHAHKSAQACIDLATEQGFMLLVAGGTIFRGWALAASPSEPAIGQAHLTEGIAQIEQGLSAWRATGAEVLRPYGLALLAEAQSRMGWHENGLTLLAEAFAVTDHTEERRWEAELHRVKGELLLAQGIDHAAEAEACFHQALDVAWHQQAKSWELRAATSLARLWQQQGNRAEAYELLAPVYNWFTEGFDTADLQDAKALLEELA
jgi:predicted ATPase/class 3 adenylate cyclase